jgi:hypothetical protein
VLSRTAGGDDALQMAAWRILGPVRVAVDNGLHQLIELEERARRPARERETALGQASADHTACGGASPCLVTYRS